MKYYFCISFILRCGCLVEKRYGHDDINDEQGESDFDDDEDEDEDVI